MATVAQARTAKDLNAEFEAGGQNPETRQEEVEARPVQTSIEQLGLPAGGPNMPSGVQAMRRMMSDLNVQETSVREVVVIKKDLIPSTSPALATEIILKTETQLCKIALMTYQLQGSIEAPYGNNTFEADKSFCRRLR